MNFIEEIARRRTFGIISHPDAGKTTLTEKLLLFGGAIQEAGAVKSHKIKKSATSDFMEIEKQRGISVSTSVLAFNYEGIKINILDTPGHKDFAEDTFRTLTAVDSVIVVIDVAKGVEEQTEKLVEVCRMREIPIIVFINKLDREGKDGFDLLDELEKKLNFKVCPLSFPIGMGYDFQGIYNLWEKNLMLFEEENKQKIANSIKINEIKDPALNDLLGKTAAEKLIEEVEIINEVYPNFSKEDYLKCKQQPVFFGSALNNFGVKELLNCFISIAPAPMDKISDERIIKPSENKFSGFVFKIHANMDPRHRNRIAFIRICSGKFQRGNNYYHVRNDKKYRFSNATAFMAQQKETIDEAFPGDIIGLYDTGNLKIGDTLNEGEKSLYKGIPSFSPELFKEVLNLDAMKSKQLEKGLTQLMDEGVAQLFTYEMGSRKVVGTVGALQFEVLQYRLLNEYNAKVSFSPINIYKACWIDASDKNILEAFVKDKYRHIAKDKEDKLVFMAESKSWLQMVEDNFPDIQFHSISEF